MDLSTKTFVPLGNYIALCKRKNKNLDTTKLVGVSSEKKIINSPASQRKTNLKICWLVERGEFVVRLMDIEKTKKLAISLYESEGRVIVSSQYHVFKVINQSLDNHYLMLIFNKAITEAQLLYMCFGGIRGGLSWNDFTKLPIFVPPLEQQKKIVYKYQTIEKLIKTKRKMNELLEQWMLAYYHIMFDNLEESEYIHKAMGELFNISGGGALRNITKS